MGDVRKEASGEDLAVLGIRREDDGFVSANGTFSDDLVDAIQCDVLGFCGCGSPWANLLLIRRGLQCADAKPSTDAESEMCRNTAVGWFGNEPCWDFFLYWTDTQDLTEHGTSVGGSWLSDKGRVLLSVLKTMELE